MKSSYEGLGEKFDKRKFLIARETTIKLVREVVSQVYLGMSEKDGHDLIDKALKKYGCEKKWHPNKFRIGKNTTKSFKETSEEVSLKENDIFFIDIGPVLEGQEADYGETFIFGEKEEYNSIIGASKKVFEETKEEFLKTKMSGHKLYDFAEKCAEEKGFQLNLSMSGHRIGDFPHALHYKGKLNTIDFEISQGLWVLEILLKHKTKEFGAFFEDVI